MKQSKYSDAQIMSILKQAASNTILIFSSSEYCLRGRSRDVFVQQLCWAGAALKE